MEHQHSRMRAIIAGMLLLLPAACSLAATVDKPDGSSAIITIPVTIINQQNTCKVTFDGPSVSGGTYTFQKTLLKGQEQEHQPFRAIVTCANNSEVETALTLRPAGSFQASNNRVGLHPVGDLSVKSGELWLVLADGNPAPMGANAAATSQAVFCKGMTSDTVRNSCTLTPVTHILPTAPGGPVSTTLTFDVVYP